MSARLSRLYHVSNRSAAQAEESRTPNDGAQKKQGGNGRITYVPDRSTPLGPGNSVLQVQA